MQRQDALKSLRAALPGLKAAYGVKDLALFGSVARDEAGPESDVDILVTFQGKTQFRSFMGLQFALEDLLGTRIDLVTGKALKDGIRPGIAKDIIHVA